jgi:hypothetical protein
LIRINCGARAALHAGALHADATSRSITAQLVLGLPLAEVVANGLDVRPHGAHDVFQFALRSAEQFRPLGELPLFVHIDPGRARRRALGQFVGHVFLLLNPELGLPPFVIDGARDRSMGAPIRDARCCKIDAIRTHFSGSGFSTAGSGGHHL